LRPPSRAARGAARAVAIPVCEWCRTPLAPETGGYVVDIPPVFQVFDVHAACLAPLTARIKEFVEKP